MSIVAIVGPTASGKTALALRLAEQVDLEVVSADALQVYRGFDIGTAKPGAAERARVPHHLLDILDPDQAFSAGRFAEEARTAVAQIRRRGRLPVVVGGSGLYLRALLEGIGTLPRSDPEVRAALAARSADRGQAAQGRPPAHPAGARDPSAERPADVEMARRPPLRRAASRGVPGRIDPPASALVRSHRLAGGAHDREGLGG
jgi:tRNA dimethylallyltransferase